MSFQVIAITKPAMYLFMEIQKIDSSYYPEVYMKKEGPAAKLYIKWAASMVTSLDTSVPCVMYMQADAPNPIYHEGTNFSRTTGGLFVSTSYDYDAPLDEYGIIRQPKWGHLKDLHNFIKLCEEALIATDPAVTSFHPNVKVVVYKIDNVCAVYINTTKSIFN
ncbi:beta-galactosidase 8 isoform X2 [Arachis hypogaea]|uniref:beta-galactosidase 8 isoform X2 n=1 Tax=Arachis hypogaea TaxID=3818 RepID=UPI003B21AE2D